MSVHSFLMNKPANTVPVVICRRSQAGKVGAKWAIGVVA